MQDTVKLNDEHFSEKLNLARKKYLDRFITVADSTIVESSGWNYDQNLLDFTNEIDALCATKRKAALELLAKSIQDAMENRLPELITVELNQLTPKEDLWDNVIAGLSNVIIDSEKQLQTKLTGFECVNIRTWN